MAELAAQLHSAVLVVFNKPNRGGVLLFVPLLLQEVAHRQHSSGGDALPAGEVHLPGLGDQQQQQQQPPGEKDAGATAAGSTAAAASAAAAAANGGDVPQVFQLAVARNPDQVWTQVQGLQERAKLQVQAATAAAAAPTSDSGGPAAVPGSSSAAAAAAGGLVGSGGGTGQPGSGLGQQPSAEAALDPLLAQLLAKAGSLQGCWGKAMFGFNEVEVLQLMEALPQADQTSSYQFVDERGGWEKEREFLAKGRWARRLPQAAAKKRPPAAAAAAAAGKKQQGAAAAGSSPAAAAAAGGGGKGSSGTPSKKRPHPASAAAAAAAANAGAPSSLFGTAAPKRYRWVGPGASSQAIRAALFCPVLWVVVVLLQST